MRAYLLLSLAVLTGCKSGNSLTSKPVSSEEAWVMADRKIAPTADTLKAIDIARNVVAYNLRNAETIGFKAIVVHVDDKSLTTSSDLSTGPLENTKRPLDLAISGQGYFRVRIDPGIGDGLAYTRNGSLYLNNKNELVIESTKGYALNPSITIPSDTVEVDIDNYGRILVLAAGKTAKQMVGQIQLHTFVNASGLRHLEHSLYQETDSSGQPIECMPENNDAGSVLQGYLEKSNVQIDREHLRDEYLKRWREALLQSMEKWP